MVQNKYDSKTFMIAQKLGPLEYIFGTLTNTAPSNAQAERNTWQRRSTGPRPLHLTRRCILTSIWTFWKSHTPTSKRLASQGCPEMALRPVRLSIMKIAP